MPNEPNPYHTRVDVYPSPTTLPSQKEGIAVHWTLPFSAVRRRLGVFAASALLLGTLAACGTSTPAAAPTTATTLRIALPTQLNLNWWAPIVPGVDCYTLTGGYLGPDTYEPLLWISPQDTIDYGRSIASSIVPSDHDTRFTINIKTSWRWSNGQPITAADVVYDADLILAASGPKSPLAYCFAGSGGVPADWQSVTATGPETVVVTTTKSVNPVWFEHNGLSQLVPIPKATWDHYSNLDQELSWINSVGAKPMNPVYRVVDGPYQLTKAVTDGYWEFGINPHYTGPQKPTIQHIIYLYQTSAANTFAQLKRGALDLAHIDLSLYSSTKSLAGYHITTEPLFSFSYVELNYRNNAYGGGGPLIQKLYVRQALQDGIDQAAMIKEILLGFATPTFGPVPRYPHNAYYDYNMPDYYPFDIAAGKALLAAHGWTMQNGVMTKNGQTLSFRYLVGTGSTTGLNEVEDMVANWAKEGIKVSIETLAPSTVSTIITTPADSDEWNMAGGGWIYAPDFYPSGGSLFATNAGVNYGAYNSSRMDQLIQASYAGGTPQQVAARFTAYEKFAAQNLPVLWQPNSDYVFVVSNQLKGFARNFNPYWSYTSDNYLSMGS